MSCYSLIQQLRQLVWLNQMNQVQFGKCFSYIFHLASQNYLLQGISLKLTINISFYISFIVFCSLDALKKGFQEERNMDKDQNSRGGATSQLPQKEIGMMKFLALTSHLLARITLLANNLLLLLVSFKKSILRHLSQLY